MAGYNGYEQLPLATLQTLQGQYVQALTDIAKSGTSMSIPGRSLTRSNLTEINATLGLIGEAIASKTGTRKTNAVFRFGGQ